MDAGQAVMESRPKLLITGAAGYLGSLLRVGLRDEFRLRLADIAPLKAPAAPDEEFVQADLADARAVETMTAGVDSIVHLGGSAVEAPWDTILTANIAGTVNLFEAARACGVKRVVYASTHHVVGFQGRDRKAGPETPVRPDSRYAVSKVFGEALGRLYADKHGLSVICQRIGVARPAPPHRRALSNWISERDYLALTRCCLMAPDIRFLVVYGASQSRSTFYEDPNAARIGFRPQDDSAAFEEAVIAANPDEEPLPDRLFQGGAYCAAEFSGDLGKID
jgi:uronate dehydrogenase